MLHAGERPVAQPTRSLRNVVVLAFLPLCLVFGVGISIVWADARHVHEDVLRMFEELREVALARSLQDELHGLSLWVESVPEATEATHHLVFDDLRHHLATARATFAGFSVTGDPSLASHDTEEKGVLRRIGDCLTSIGEGLDSDRPIEELSEHLTLAVHDAGVLASTVEAESHQIGDALDRRSERLVEIQSLFGIAALLTVSWLGFLLLRRVLVPVRELREVVDAVTKGEEHVAPTIRHRDELGELAEEFAAMATRVRRSREELEERVEQRSREVLRTARLAELGELAAGIAHEVNNPLASIATCAEGLLRDCARSNADPEALRDYLEIIKSEAMRTRDITSRLLRFARHDAGAHELVWLGDELREVAPMFAHQFADAGVKLELSTGDPSPAIMGDPAEWRQVLFNLVRNALDASPRGSTVHVSCRQREDQVVFEVRDEGEGIAEANLERVFEPFFTTKPPGKGTGLGLAIVHRIVTGHGGHITVECGPSGGTTFAVTTQAAVG